MSRKLTRRDFVKTTGAGLVATAWSATAVRGLTAGGAQLRQGFKKAVKYTMVAGDASVADKFKLLKSIGFDGVDVNVHLDHNEVRRAQDESGLTVHGVVGYDHWRLPLSDPDPEIRAQGVESFRGSLEDAKAYGATSVLLVPAKVTKDVSYADAYARSQSEIRKLIPLAEDLEIHILIENVWNNFLLSPLELARYIDELQSPMMGVYFDVGNVVRYGWPEQWIRTLGKRIKKLDVKEYSRQLESTQGPYAGFKVEIGEGDCDWPAVMTALADIEFAGWATAEVSGGDEQRLRDIAVRMDRVLSG